MAVLLQTLNAEKLKLPEQLPVGAQIALPQRNAPALILFSILAVLLLAVGPAGGCRQDRDEMRCWSPGFSRNLPGTTG